MKKVLLLSLATLALTAFTGENFASAADTAYTDSLIARSQVRQRFGSRYSWRVSSWGACSATRCGTSGTQNRRVQCVKYHKYVVADYHCAKPKPAISQSCSVPACPITTTTVPHPVTTTLPAPPTTLPAPPTTLPHPVTTTTVPHPVTTTTTLPPVTTTLPPVTTTLPAPTTTLPSVTTTTLPAGNTMFPASSIWYQDISSAPLHPDSTTIINWLTANGGWGTGSMQVDLSINLLSMNSSTPMANLVQNSGYYSPDCDDGLKTFPIPAGGAVENNPGYQCNDGGDCHLLVIDKANNKLYESYQTSVSGNNLSSTCAIVWDLTRNYGPSGRGEQCTSTDAAGFPVAALLVTADEVASGSVNHAMRFILPNARMQAGVYLHPATHAGGPSGPSTAVPYGAHFRLKASVDISKLSPPAQIVAKAMKKYGMFLADGGNIALTFANDQFSTAKWSQLGFSQSDLSSLKTSDFEMVQDYDGMRINYNSNCVRNP